MTKHRFIFIILFVTQIIMLPLAAMQGEAAVEKIQAAARGFLERKQYRFLQNKFFVQNLKTYTDAFGQFPSITKGVTESRTNHYWYNQDMVNMAVKQENLMLEYAKRHKNVAEIKYVLYENIFMPEDKEAVLARVHNIEFLKDLESALKYKSSFIVIEEFLVKKNFRQRGIGGTLFADYTHALKQNHPGTVIIWEARPFDDSPLNPQQLSAFYKKCGGRMLHQTQHYAYFCMD